MLLTWPPKRVALARNVWVVWCASMPLVIARLVAVRLPVVPALVAPVPPPAPAVFAPVPPPALAVVVPAHPLALVVAALPALAVAATPLGPVRTDKLPPKSIGLSTRPVPRLSRLRVNLISSRGLNSKRQPLKASPLMLALSLLPLLLEMSPLLVVSPLRPLLPPLPLQMLVPLLPPLPLQMLVPPLLQLPRPPPPTPLWWTRHSTTPTRVLPRLRT